MEVVTRQDLIYAASALRESAHANEKQAKDPTFHSTRELFLNSANEKRLLAAKFDRIAKSMKL